MRILIADILFVLALYRAWVDWRLTMGEGRAYRLASVDGVWQQLSPGTYENWRPWLESLSIPYLWDPVLMMVLAMPTALVLFILAAVFWLIRRRS